MKNGIHFEKTTNGFGGIYFFYQCGGNYEKPKFRGLTHLAEHLACKEEKKFEKDFVMNSFDNNAMTGDDFVCFYCNGINDLMADFAGKYLSTRNYIPTQEEFETEKLIVIQEVQSALCNDTLNESFHRGMFDYSGACGDIEAIQNISFADFIKFYKSIYSKPSVVIFTGDEQMKKVYNKLGKKIEFDASKKAKQPIKMNSVPDTSKFKAWSKKDTNSLVYFTEVKGKQNKTQLQFLMKLLGDGFYSPFFQVIREKNKLCYYVQGHFEKMGKYNLFQVWTETSQEEKFTSTLFDLLNDFEKHVTKEYFQSYCKKIETDFRKIRLVAGFGLAYHKYFDEESFFNLFDPSKPEFSYESMVKLASKIADKKNWKKMSHCGDQISFTETV